MLLIIVSRFRYDRLAEIVQYVITEQWWGPSYFSWTYLVWLLSVTYSYAYCTCQSCNTS